MIPRIAAQHTASDDSVQPSFDDLDEDHESWAAVGRN